MKRIWLMLLGLLLLINTGNAEVAKASAKVISVYDGDTATAVINLGLGVYKEEVIRLNGIDTPEIKGESEYEKALAVKARDFFINEVNNKTVTLEILEREKYGRLLVNIIYEEKNLKDEIINAGLGRAYDGGQREEWVEPANS